MRAADGPGRALNGLAVAAMLLAVVPVQAELQLQSVAADRIYYEPGAEARFTVVVANPDDQPATATLQVELIRDVDTRKALGEEPVTVPAKGRHTWTGSLKLPPVLGMELRAALRRGEQVLVQKSDYFSCARSVHQVLMFGHGDNHGPWQCSGRMDEVPETYPAEFAEQWRSTHGNCLEKFAWGPSDFDDLTPADDRWWSGQTSYNECQAHMVAIIDAMHQQGIKVVTYGKGAAGGVVGFERYRRRPDLAPHSHGRFWSENYSAAYLDWMAVLGPPHPHAPPVPAKPQEMEESGYSGSGAFQPFVPEGGQQWCCIWYDCGDPEVAGIGIGELVGSARMFGFDGVRFDGEFAAGRFERLDGSWSAPENWDAEAANVALVQRMKKECWAAKPGYLFGYNTGTDITWSVPLDNTPPTFREKCKDDGLIANEAYAFPGDVPWLVYCRRVRREAEIVRYYGGHYATYAFNRTADNLYNCILQYGLRAHLMNAYGGPGWEWVRRSAARFSRLLWDDSLTTWRGAPQALKVTGSRNLWWEEFAAVGAAPEGGTRYIIHLYNRRSPRRPSASSRRRRSLRGT